jgi:hypothetical protein
MRSPLRHFTPTDPGYISLIQFSHVGASRDRQNNHPTHPAIG